MTDYFAPISGNPAGIQGEVAQMGSVADAMATAARTLRALRANDDDYISAAMDQVATNIGGVAVDLEDSARRYQSTAEALASYASVLEQAQREVGAANRGAAGIDIARAQYTVNAYQDQYEAALRNPTAPEQDRVDAHRALLASQLDLRDQSETLNSLSTQVDSARQSVDGAAAAAVRAIEDAISASRLNDSWIYDVEQTVDRDAHEFRDWYNSHLRPLLTWMAKVAGEIATALNVVSLVLAVCGFPEIAGVLASVAVGLSLFQAAVTLLNFAMGRFSWSGLLEVGIASATTVLAAKAGGGGTVDRLLGRIGTKFRNSNIVRLVERSRIGRSAKTVIKTVDIGRDRIEGTISDHNPIPAGWNKVVMRIDKFSPRAGRIAENTGKVAADYGKEYVKDQVNDYRDEQVKRILEGKPPAPPDVHASMQGLAGPLSAVVKEDVR